MTSTAATSSNTQKQTENVGDSSFHSVSVAGLRLGTKLNVPIYDNRDVLLLADGATVTPMFLDKLKNRGVQEVKVHESELDRVYACKPLGQAKEVPDDRVGISCDLQTEASTRLDVELRKSGALGLPSQGDAFAEELQSHGTNTYNKETLNEFVDKHHESVEQMESVFDDLMSGNGLDLGLVSGIADEALSELSQDSDLFACLGINPFSDKYPARHSMHVSMLAMSIGTHLGLDRDTLKELAIGCLIHDAGMLKIDERVFRSPEVVNRISFLEITKHPIVVFDMMKEMQAIPSRSAFIVYQMHERCNGSGYPRRREAEQIHFLSKVAAVADVFVGLVAPRPHRPGMLPYYAIEKIVRGVREGLYDASAVRALLHTVSLFPIGSFVELSNGHVGRVIRTNGEQFDSPIIETWEPSQLHLEPTVLDLAESDTRVSKALPKLETQADETTLADNWE